jgi:hypothetical protein
MSVHPIVAQARGEADPREPLREALAAKAKAQGALASHRAAITRAEDLLEQSQQRLTAAESAVATAKADYAASIARSVVDGAPTTTGSVRKARAGEVEARDEIEARECAVETLRGHLAGFEEEIRRCEIGVIAARNAVLAQIAQPLLERLALARGDWFGIQQTLRVLVADERYPELVNSTEYIKRTEAARAPLAAPKQALDHLLTETVHLDGPAVQAWQAFRAALLANPDALQPEAL